MALATYADLKSSVANWLKNGTLTPVIPDFVAMAEARMNRTLRLPQMETTTILGIEGAIEYLTDADGAVLVVSGDPVIEDTGVFDLPADFLEVRRVVETTLGQPLDQVTPEYAARQYANSPSGVPGYFAIIGSQLLTYPPNENGIELTYYAKIPSLSTNSTNWLMTAAPDVYLGMTLVEAYTFLKDPDSAAFWENRASSAIADLRASGNAWRYAHVAIRSDSPTP